ncbi:hypothetical protein AVEN_82145-1 [Araneus ventricosus]|uniref:Uncharacterized protein n=1 Tax=Araneus ventricosus TaxID=182803 RepID=A0A4Y2LVC3_ARAVE|nr:hypothetical protein AVEN_82145-1 [Araneus ventricosus]
MAVKSPSKLTGFKSFIILTSRFEATRGLFVDGPCHFEPSSDDEDDIWTGTPSRNFRIKREDAWPLCLIQLETDPIHYASSSFEPKSHRFQSRGLANMLPRHQRALKYDSLTTQIYLADGGVNETAEESEQRRSEDRLRTIARRYNMSAEETEERRSDDQLRAIARRNNESFEIRNQRQASDRFRTLNSRATENNEQRERRIHCNALGNQNRIGFDELLMLDVIDSC